MTVISENLYDEIICKEASRSSELRMISGYGSWTFLKKVKQEFPSLKITLIIGMTVFGISKSNHEGFQKICRQYDDVNVYYTIDGLPNHMKLMQFINDNQVISFLGSANFTENGFINQKEIMANIDDDVTKVFINQQAMCKMCTSEDIHEYVLVFSDESSISENSYDLEISLPTSIDEDGNGKLRKQDMFTKLRFRNLRSNIDISYYSVFDLEIILGGNNPRWKDSGINAWVNGKTPTLLQTPSLFFDKIFPLDENFEIYADCGKRYLAKIGGRFSGHLEFLNGSIYDYVREKIGLISKRPISRDDLLNYGNTKLHFERIDRLKYLMSFTSSKYDV